MKLTINSYSTALFSTWHFIEEFKLLFDAGDGLVANLMGKCGKIKHVFISHADRDHVTGLLQFNQLFAQHNPMIYYPKDAQSFPYLNKFFQQFDPHNRGTGWQAIDHLEKVDIKPGYVVESFENSHVNKVGLKSLSYRVIEEKNKLKTEFLNLSPEKLIELKKRKGNGYLFDKRQNTALTYSGDTPVEDYTVYDQSEVLIHEATFLKKTETTEKNSHSSLEEVMKMVSEIKVGKLVLSHFSSRYDQAEIDREILKLIKDYQIKTPVWRIPIGKTVKDILNTNPINQ